MDLESVRSALVGAYCLLADLPNGNEGLFFFTDIDKQTPNSALPYINVQGSADAYFGPVSNGAAAGMDEYRVTSLHSATFDPTAYAACDAIVCVQKDTADATLVNIILKPLVQPALNFAPIKCIIYKGIKAGSLIDPSPDTATRGAPISIPAQATGSSIHATTTVTTPGAAST